MLALVKFQSFMFKFSCDRIGAVRSAIVYVTDLAITKGCDTFETISGYICNSVQREKSTNGQSCGP